MRQNRKTIFFTSVTIILFIVALTLLNSNNEETDYTLVEVEPVMLDLGTIQSGNEYDVPITLKNIGASSLFIESISTSCNCMDSNIYLPIPSGKTKTIHIKLIPDFTGFYTERVFINCNTENSPLLVVIKGNVENI